MARQGQHRAVAGTKLGRRFTGSKGARLVDPTSDWNIPKDIQEHNKKIEEKRQADLARRKKK